MKLICPKCKAKNKIGEYSRYYIWRCNSCGHRYRGIHADVARLDFVVNWFNPFADRSYHDYDIDCCPYCGWRIDLGHALTTGGYESPSHCPACTRRLPTWKADQDSDDVLDDEE